MSCQTNIPIHDIAEAVADMLGEYQPPSIVTNQILDAPIIRGNISLDEPARLALCSALTTCIQDKIQAYTDSLEPTPPVTYGDVRVSAFDTEGDNLVITTSDGIKHDLTRNEFADWLASEGSALTTDAELQAALNNTDTSGTEAALAGLQAQIDAINTDQATIAKGNGGITLTNEDGTTSTIPFADMLSNASGQLLGADERGFIFTIEAPADVSRLHVDSRSNSNGDDNNAGSREAPLATFAEAQRRLATYSNKSSTILLHAGGDYYTNNVILAENSAERKIFTYGSDYSVYGAEVERIESESGAFAWYFLADSYVRRARLHYTWKDIVYGGQNVQSLNGIFVKTNGAVSLFGITEIVEAPTGTTSPQPANTRLFGGVGALSRTGTILDDTQVPDNSYLGYTSASDETTFIFNRVQPVLPAGAYASTSPAIYATGKATIIATDVGDDDNSPVIVNNNLSTLQTDTVALVKADNFVAPKTRDPSGTIVNWSSNIVL